MLQWRIRGDSIWLHALRKVCIGGVQRIDTGLGQSPRIHYRSGKIRLHSEMQNGIAE